MLVVWDYIIFSIVFIFCIYLFIDCGFIGLNLKKNEEKKFIIVFKIYFLKNYLFKNIDFIIYRCFKIF